MDGSECMASLSYTIFEKMNVRSNKIKTMSVRRRQVRMCLIASGVLVLLILVFLEENVLTFSDASCIDIYNISEADGQDITSCLSTRTDPTFISCIYDVHQDVFISNSLHSSRLWEPNMTNLLRKILNKNSIMTVIDVGANIGYFSLLAASLGHNVVAIEPVEQNVQHFAKAIHLNTFQDKILVLRNVISNVSGRVRMELPSSTNQGAARVLTDQEVVSFSNTTTALSIVLDDLANFIHTNDVIIKLDVEGHECRSLEKSEVIFKTFRVLYIFSEWSKMTSVRHRYGVACPPDSIRQMSTMLTKRGFVPYDISRNIKLDPRNSDKWRNNDVYWQKQSFSS